MSKKLQENLNSKFVVLGYDPGGKNKNGAAIIKIYESNRISAEVTTTSSVDETLEWFKNAGEQAEVRAVGIDTLLSWSTLESGWRPMDDWIKDWLLNKGKRETKETRRSILRSNSLQGAMVVQGMAMAKKLRDKWEKIILNETHPKVQYYAKSLKVYKYDEKDKGRRMKRWLRVEISGQMDLAHFPKMHNEHEWDALYSAWVTLQSIQSKSTPDLLDIAEPKVPLIFLAGQTNYYWPF